MKVMKKINAFHKMGFLIPTLNPKLNSDEYYNNMSTDYYRRVPNIINTQIQRLPRSHLRSIFRYVSGTMVIDTEDSALLPDKRARVQRLRQIPRDIRVQLDEVLQDIRQFGYVGLLVPTDGSNIPSYECYRNQFKTHQRRVPYPIFKRLLNKNKTEIVSLFPRAAGILRIKAEPHPSHIITVEKGNVAYINALRINIASRPHIEPNRTHDELGNGSSMREHILRVIPQHLHEEWFKLLKEIKRFSKLGLLIPTKNMNIPEEQRYRNYNPSGYRLLPPSLYHRINGILNSIPSRRQIRALFPNTNGTIYLNTDQEDSNKPYQVACNVLCKRKRSIDTDYRCTSNEDDHEEFQPLLGIGNLLPVNGSIIQSIDPSTGAGNVTIQLQIQDPNLLDLIHQQIDEYEIQLKPIDPYHID
jgi:hypothetical protein